MNNGLVDCYMAALWRQGFAVQTIATLRNQPEFGTATITCNNHTDEQWQYMLDTYKSDYQIYLKRGDNLKESNEKLKYVGNGSNEYVMFMDNDLLLPPDYLKYMIQGCEKYQAMVSLHGVVLGVGKIGSYYRDRMVLRGLKTVPFDSEVDIASNCGSLFKRKWHSDYDKWYDFCGNVSMDDCYVAYFMKKKGIRRYVLKHQEGYMKHKQQLPEDDYVFNKYALTGNDKAQTDFINNYFKKL